MSHNNKLYRNFIILQEDEKEHLKDGEKPLSGYAKIEAKSDKCKISFYTQNLKSDNEYFMVLICYKKDMKKIVDLGSLKVDELGKGEAYKDYYINDIAGLNFSYDKISGAGIYKYKDGKPSFLMYGFINGESDCSGWKNVKIIKCDDANKMISEKEKKEAKVEEKKAVKIEEKDCEKKESKKKEESNCDCKKYEDKKEKPCKNDSKEEPCKKRNEEALEEVEPHKEKECKDHKEEKRNSNEVKCEHKEEKAEKVECPKCEKHQHKEIECEKEEKYHHKDKGKEEEKECPNCKCNEEKCERKEDIDFQDPCLTRGEIPITFEDYERKIEERKKENFDYEEEEEEPKETIEYNLEENRNLNLEGYRKSNKTFKLNGALGQFFTQVTSGFEEVVGEFNEIKYCKWYKVKINSIDDMCDISDYNKYNIVYYPMINYYPYIKKYGYFMLGYKYNQYGNVDYIVYGVPGTKEVDEQPYVGKTGFVTWIKNKEIGCWLMFYDYQKSTVVIPMR